jgi:hypothetical protein
VERHITPAPNRTAVAVVDSIEDEFGGRVTVAPNDGRVVFRGWALDAGAQALAAVEVGVGGARASSPCDQPRPDVAAIFGAPDAVGFRVELALDDAVPGSHAVALHGLRPDGSRVRIPLAVALDVVAPMRRFPPGVVAGAVVGFVDEIGVEPADGAAGGGASVAVPAGGALIVRGWAASPDGEPATSAYAELDGHRLLRGMSGYPRPDVAAQFGTDDTRYGFRIRVTANELGPGEHSVRVHAIVGNATAVVGDEARVSVAARAVPRVFETTPRVRGRIDVVGRVDGNQSVAEERSHLRLAASERAVVTGWAGDPAGGQMPSRVMLVVDGIAHGPVQRGIEREDVVAATACEGLRASGFSAVVRAGALGAGFHRAELIALYDAEPVVFDAFSFEVIA